MSRNMAYGNKKPSKTDRDIQEIMDLIDALHTKLYTAIYTTGKTSRLKVHYNTPAILQGVVLDRLQTLVGKLPTHKGK